MTGLTVDLRCDVTQWSEVGDVEQAACAAITVAANALAHPPTGIVSVLLTDDTEMQALNRQWRGKDKPTDVLSFPAGEDTPGFLGDIAVGYGVCARDAAALGRTLEAHLSHMLVHGILHLCGMDHQNDADAAEMEGIEVKALARLGLPNPYSAEA